VGNIAFSPISVSDGTQNWYGLGPVSVLPVYQRIGIGKPWYGKGLSRLKDPEANGCCLVDFENYINIDIWLGENLSALLSQCTQCDARGLRGATKLLAIDI
jgi:hypothetical protein